MLAVPGSGRVTQYVKDELGLDADALDLDDARLVVVNALAAMERGAEIRTRTSSLRLVSCVAVAESAWGKDAWRDTLKAWNSATVVPKRLGSLPTSLSDTRR